MSRVERDIKNLHTTLSHPHTLNNESSFNRTMNISNQVENLTSMVGTLKQKMTSFENRRYFTTPQHPKNPTATTNVFSPPLQRVRPVNPYLRKKVSPKKTVKEVHKSFSQPTPNRHIRINKKNDNSSSRYDPTPSQEPHDAYTRRFLEK